MSREKVIHEFIVHMEARDGLVCTLFLDYRAEDEEEDEQENSFK